MCGSKIWTVVAFLSCAYFTKLAVDRIHSFPADWSHDSLGIAARLIWILFMVGLISETTCWRERLFFGVVLVNFGVALAMGFWTSAPDSVVSKTRMVSVGLWGLATAVSLVLIFVRVNKPDSSDRS
jgi:hypothetical protein